MRFLLATNSTHPELPAIARSCKDKNIEIDVLGSFSLREPEFNKFRVFLKLFPGLSGSISRRILPFEISETNLFRTAIFSEFAYLCLFGLPSKYRTRYVSSLIDRINSRIKRKVIDRSIEIIGSRRYDGLIAFHDLISHGFVYPIPVIEIAVYGRLEQERV